MKQDKLDFWEKQKNKKKQRKIGKKRKKRSKSEMDFVKKHQKPKKNEAKLNLIFGNTQKI